MRRLAHVAALVCLLLACDGMSRAQAFNIPYDTVSVPTPTSLQLIADATETTVEQIRLLNSDLKGDATPNGQAYVVKVPAHTGRLLVAYLKNIPVECRLSARIINGVIVLPDDKGDAAAGDRQPAPKPQARPANGGPAKPLSGYDNRAFDLSQDRLPVNYQGHDIVALYDRLGERKAHAAKGEYETTEEYRLRLRREQAAPVGGMAVDSAFAFQSKDFEAAYDADRQALRVAVILGRVAEDSNTALQRYAESGTVAGNPERSVSVKTSASSRTYLASNALGVRVRVEEIDGEDFDLALVNWADFGAVNYVRQSDREAASQLAPLSPAAVDSVYSADALVASLKVDAQTARRVKPNLRVLLVCQPVEPLTSYRSDLTKATISNPKEYFIEYHYLHAKLLELWVYDVTTGQVYAKLKAGKP